MIIGCWILMPVLHAECLWIHPSHRGRSSVARRLWTMLRKLVIQAGYESFATTAMVDDVKQLIAHAQGIKIPGEHFSIRVV